MNETYIIFNYADGTIGKLGPIVSDDPAKGSDDPKIRHKATKWAAELSRYFDDLNCQVSII